MVSKTKQSAYTIKQYAKLTGKSTDTIRRWIKSDKLTYRKVKGEKGLEYLIYPKGFSKDENGNAQGTAYELPMHDDIQQAYVKDAEPVQKNANGVEVLHTLSPEKIINLIREGEQAKGQVEAMKKHIETMEKDIQFLRGQLSKPEKKNFGLFRENFLGSLNKKFFK